MATAGDPFLLVATITTPAHSDLRSLCFARGYTSQLVYSLAVRCVVR